MTARSSRNQRKTGGRPPLRFSLPSFFGTCTRILCMGKLIGILLVLALVAAVGFLATNYQRLEGQGPAITLDRDFKALGRNPALQLTVEDSGSGLKQVTHSAQ